MNNRNTLYFVLGTLGLFGVYYVLMSTVYAPPKRPQAAQVETVAPVAAQPAPIQAQTPAAPGEAISNRTFSLETQALRLTWRVEDGALVQAVYREERQGQRFETPFFPELRKDDQGKILAKPFPGIGGAIQTRFEGEPEVVQAQGARTVAFRNATGDRLEYRVPDQGQILGVTWASPRGAHLSLIPKPATLEEAAGLGRVFSLQDKGLQAVNWADMLKDPWFGKRKELPAQASRLGMDTGITPGKAQANHYFVAIWEMNRVAERDMITHPGFHLGSEKSGTVSGRLYLGPKQKEALESFGAPYAQVLDFGTFGLIAKGMFWVLRTMNRIIPNWGLTLIVFSVLIRLAMWSLNTKQTVSMLRMKDLEPHQKALQAKYEKFGNDMTKKAEMQKELMAFYKKNGHNPMGGCLPMLLQMPVFFALWSMLQNVYELRHAGFLFWKDLSGNVHSETFWLMPILLGASMFIQSKLTPATGDPAQRKMMMYMMPAMMVFFFSSTPVGLCLYYLVFNLVGLFQTWVIMRNYKPQPVIL